MEAKAVRGGGADDEEPHEREVCVAVTVDTEGRHRDDVGCQGYKKPRRADQRQGGSPAAGPSGPSERHDRRRQGGVDRGYRGPGEWPKGDDRGAIVERRELREGVP